MVEYSLEERTDLITKSLRSVQKWGRTVLLKWDEKLAVSENKKHMLHIFLSAHEKTELVIAFSCVFFLSESDQSSCDELYQALKS